MSPAAPTVLVALRRVLARPTSVHPSEILGGCEQAALVLARRLAGDTGTVVAVAVGGARREGKALEYAAAAGADRAVLVSGRGADGLGFEGVARVLGAVTREVKPDLVLCGARSQDRGSGAVGPALAEGLEVPHVSPVTSARWASDGVEVELRADSGLHRLKLRGLAVLCVAGPAGELPARASSGDPVIVEKRRFAELGLLAGLRGLEARERAVAISGGRRPPLSDAAALVDTLSKDGWLP